MRLNSIGRIRSKTINSYTKIVLVGFVLLLLVFIFLCQSYKNKCENRVRGTKAMLSLHRSEINMYFDLYGRYPQSLDEIWRDFRSDEYRSKKYNIAFKLQSENSVPKHRELNGQGGYYYKPDTGEIKLNLTKPVKEYFFWYGGKYADEIPSSW